MAQQTLPCNDPIIQITLTYPDNVSIPPSGSDMNIYRASVTVKNTSQLPLLTSSVKVTLDDSLMGYDATLWDDTNKRPIDTADLPIGALAAGGSNSADFLFRIDRAWPMPPTQSGKTMTFHVMPSYEIKHEVVDGFASQSQVVVQSREDLGGGTNWKTNPPDWSTQPSPADPLIQIEQGFFGTLVSKTTGWNQGYTQTPRIYVASHLKVTNKAPVPITSFKYQIAVDDQLVNYDVKCLGEQGPWGQATVSRDLGPIQPGATTDTYAYWIAVFHLDGAAMAPETQPAFLQVAPWYTVEYQRDDSVNHSIPVNT
ncbi:hypothetical protein [Polyangium aurulentum]|uniref:hypothetical protein n=1 Tax=Polyangium aurulentum TaxID=2567896 RepID=UPI0010ADD724|nr:hypothetical protein [Polyangium aurulentum]UQA58374.1 hypothetical protein E8A73_045210 [Polyangium aurulentum]